MAGKDDKMLMAELMMFKKELQAKTGKISGEELKKDKFDQEQFLKNMKQKKQKKDEENSEIDISRYVRSSNITFRESIIQLIETAKEKQWKEPKSYMLINVLFACYMSLGDYKKAELEYKKGIALEGNNSDFLYNSAEFYFRTGKMGQAVECLTKILKNAQDEDALYLMGAIFYMQGHLENALQLINKTILNDKNSKRVYKNLLFIALMMNGQREKVLELVHSLVEEDGKNIAARIVCENLEVDRRDFESYSTQERMVGKLLGENDTVYSPCIHVSKAIYFLENRRYKEAEIELMLAEKKYPECICAKVERIRSYIEQKKYEESFLTAQDALKINIKFNPVLVELLKLCYYLRKDDKIKSISDEILLNNKNTRVYLYNNGEVIDSFKLEEYKNDFISKMKSYKEKADSFKIDSGNSMLIYKLFRDTRLCGIKIN